MSTSKHWTVDIVLEEHPETRSTRAEALLHGGDPSDVRGIGRSWRNPIDPEVPEIGDELAVARALTDLSDRLRAAAADEIQAEKGEASHGW